MNKILTMMLLALLFPSAISAQGSGALYQGLLPTLPPNREVVIQEITLPPGRIGSAHRHDAYVWVYVVEGAIDMQVQGGEVTRVNAGEVFVESPDDIHTMSNNPSSTEPAKFLAILIKEAGVPVVLPVD
jgi:quercetin dioxygenase-like cupin family protein